MKYGMPQIIVGILILVASIFVTGWMIFDAPETLRHQVTENSVTGGYIELVPQNNTWFAVARYGSWALPALGAVIIIAGAARMAGTRAAALRAVPVLLLAGLMVASVGAIVTAWGFPSSFESINPVITESGQELNVHIYTNPGHGNSVQETAAFLLVPLGLLVAGYGIVQFFKLRHQPGIVPANDVLSG